MVVLHVSINTKYVLVVLLLFNYHLRRICDVHKHYY